MTTIELNYTRRRDIVIVNDDAVLQHLRHGDLLQYGDRWFAVIEWRTQLISEHAAIGVRIAPRRTLVLAECAPPTEAIDE